MAFPIQVQFHGMGPSAALDEHARELARKLAANVGDLMSCRVTIEVEEKHHHKGRLCGVRVDLTLPGHEIVVNHVRHEDAYVALRDAFDNARRQLEETVQKRRGEVKHHASRSLEAPPPDTPLPDEEGEPSPTGL